MAPLIYAGLMLQPFLISRHILCGAGSVVRTPRSAHYEISQRSRFIQQDISEATTHDRPIVCTKKEPHAKNYHRLHLICGDANMSEFSTHLKMGVTGIILRMLEENWLDPFMLVVPNGVHVLHDISKDLKCKQTYEVYRNHKKQQLTAIDMQQCFLDKALLFVEKQGCNDETRIVFEQWQYVLDALQKQPEKLFGKVDWITKKILLDKVMEGGLEMSHPRIASMDIMYHALDPVRGIYYKLEKKNPEWKIIPDSEVKKYQYCPPPTRARARNKLTDFLKQKKTELVDMDWDSAQVKGKIYLLTDPFDEQFDPVYFDSAS